MLIDASSERPEPQPHLIVQHKNEQSGRDPIGPAYLIDPRIYKDELRPFNPNGPTDVPGFKNLGWQERSGAQAYAKFLGARFEAI